MYLDVLSCLSSCVLSIDLKTNKVCGLAFVDWLDIGNLAL